MSLPMLRDVSKIQPKPFFTRLARYIDLSAPDIDAISDAIERELTVQKRKDIVLEGYACNAVYLVQEGFAARYKLLRNGKRQILGVILPGDIIGLPEALFDSAICSVSSITSIKLDVISLKGFMDLCYSAPAVSLAVIGLSQEELALSSDHLIDVGRRDPLERVAHFILELQLRLHSVGCATQSSMTLPVSQELIGDLLGLSAPHVNRMLRQLREQALVSIRDRMLTITDGAGLQFLAKWEPRNLKKGSMTRGS